jgi:dTDP-D-glucose 4,6-dehydratase
MSVPTSGEPLGDVLVVGGCGFLGHHVVRELLADPSCSSISVMSRSPFKNRFDGVKYYMYVYSFLYLFAASNIICITVSC